MDSVGEPAVLIPQLSSGDAGYHGQGRFPGTLLLLGHQRDGRGALHRARGDLPHEEEWGRGAVRCHEYDRGDIDKTILMSPVLV